MPIIRTQKMEVKLKRPLVEISLPEFKRGLVDPPTFPWLKAEVSSEKVLPVVESQAPIDGKEIVEWMHVATAAGAILDGTAGDYSKSGNLLVWAANDLALPGIKVGDLTTSSMRPRQTATVVTPRGNFSIPFPGKGDGIFSDILAWGAYIWQGILQWVLALLQWKSLASVPINDRVRFANVGGYVAPQFFIVKSRFPPPVQVMHLGFTSDKAQKVSFQMRSVSDYTNVLASDILEIPAGESSIEYIVFGFPFVEPFVAHFQPEDESDTILDSLTVTPP